MEVQLVTALLIGLVCMQNICASDALSESSFSNLNYPFPLSEDETEPLFEAHIGDRKPTSPALSESSFSNLKYPFLLSENEKEPLFEAHIGDRKPTSPDALSESSFSNLKYPFPLSENEKKLLFEVHIGDRKPTSPDALSENSFSNLKYPFPLSENETEPLYEAHIGDRKQTSPVTPVRKDFLYFANRRFLAYMNRNGSELRGFRLTNTSNAVAVDFDIRLGYMIWSDNAHKVIAAARFNGSGPVVLVNSSINATDGLAWDWVNQKLYWTDAKDKEIEVIDPLSTHRKLLISTGSLSIPRAIVVDPPKRRMYWTDCGTPAKIERASMDGTSREVLHSTGLVRPNALTLDYDNQILYWMDAFLKRLESSNADGSNRKLLSTTQLVHPFGITFFQNRLYWTDRQTNAIYSASVNLPTVVSVVKSGLRLDPMGISVVSAERQPAATNPCQPNNGGCSHMCLLSSAPGGRMCACPDGFDFQLAANGRDCIITPVRKDFLYFANRRFLAYMNRNGSELRGFRLTNTSNAVAVDFDIRLGYMIWSDNAHKVIVAARFNGSGPVVLVNSSINATDGLAWDWVNQKLYWTDAKDKEIEVTDPLSIHRKLLISTGSLSIPRAIVVDPQKRRMYWTDYGTPAKIERASMDGTSREVLHSTGLVRPNALTLDYDNQILYWMDAFLKRLESSNADGSNRKLLSTMQLVHPFGITFFQNRLYWTDRQTNAIYSASVNLPTVVSVVKSGLRLDPMGISVVSAERQLPATNPCQPNNGGCSHMCLLSSAPGGHMCACPDGFDFQLAANGRDCIMPCRNGNIRLVGGKTAYEGRVEVCWKKTWGTVCDDDWSSFDAIVACRQLGFPTTGALALHNAPFGQGAGPIFLDDLLCTSRERKLVNCTHRGIGVHNCVHREDAGLRCPAPPASCTNGDIRLRDGRNRFEGRVEICNNNKWGTVCDDAWGTTDANVACRQLGFASTGAIARVRAFFGQGTGSILLDQVACTGTETRLVNCRSNPLGDHDCSHFEDAGVICRQI